MKLLKALRSAYDQLTSDEPDFSFYAAIAGLILASILIVVLPALIVSLVILATSIVVGVWLKKYLEEVINFLYQDED